MKLVAVDLFCGVGGLTKGLALSGIDVVAGVDIDASCCFSYEKNNNSVFIHSDVADLQYHDIIKLYPSNSVKILAGCAPCQPFSKYTKRYRKDGFPDGKWKLLYQFVRVIKLITPDIISMENVPELANEKVFQDFLETLIELNYNVSWSIVFCPDYGVPQNRKRLVLLASKFQTINLIAPLYSSENYMTVRDAIGNLPPINDGEECLNDHLHRASKLSALNKKRIQLSKQGGTWRDWPEELQLECHKKGSGKSYPSVYGRLTWDEPSSTITTQFYGYGNGRFGHPEQNRALSLREGALLQSFPTNYIFEDDEHRMKIKEIGIHIGNAVPVELGRAIGNSIILHINEVNSHNEKIEKYFFRR